MNLMTALAVIGRIQYWLVVGTGWVALSLSRLMSLNSLLKKFSEIQCDSRDQLQPGGPGFNISGADVMCFTQNWAKSCLCLLLLPACAQRCHCSSHP